MMRLVPDSFGFPTSPSFPWKRLPETAHSSQADPRFGSRLGRGSHQQLQHAARRWTASCKTISRPACGWFGTSITLSREVCAYVSPTEYSVVREGETLDGGTGVARLSCGAGRSLRRTGGAAGMRTAGGNPNRRGVVP